MSVLQCSFSRQERVQTVGALGLLKKKSSTQRLLPVSGNCPALYTGRHPKRDIPAGKSFQGVLR